MKPEPYRLLPETYPVRLEVQTRFGDLDLLGHINNVAVGDFYQEGRARLNRHVFPKEMRDFQGIRLVMADFHVTYLDEGFYPEPLLVMSGVSRTGRTSYTIAQALFQNSKCIGKSESVLVNAGEAGPASLSDDAIAKLENYHLKT
jgi:acyl-CoA thioester hydrolase